MRLFLSLLCLSAFVVAQPTVTLDTTLEEPDAAPGDGFIVDVDINGYTGDFQLLEEKVWVAPGTSSYTPSTIPSGYVLTLDEADNYNIPVYCPGPQSTDYYWVFVYIKYKYWHPPMTGWVTVEKTFKVRRIYDTNSSWSPF